MTCVLKLHCPHSSSFSMQAGTACPGKAVSPPRPRWSPAHPSVLPPQADPHGSPDSRGSHAVPQYPRTSPDCRHKCFLPTCRPAGGLSRYLCNELTSRVHYKLKGTRVPVCNSSRPLFRHHSQNPGERVRAAPRTQKLRHGGRGLS